MIIYNDSCTVESLRAGQVVLIVRSDAWTPAWAVACTVESVYRDEPGWTVEYRYAALGGGTVHGSAYFHSDCDLVDVISVADGEGS